MQVTRVFNNNVVLATDELGREAVLTGKGLGFQRRPGDAVDPALIERRFIPAQNAESVGEVLAAIPLERIALVERVFRSAASELSAPVASSSVIAVVDHVSAALDRTEAGLEMDYPLRAEVAHLHPEELRLAERMVQEINAAQPIQLAAGEASALALHLFTAAVAAPSTQEAQRQSRIIAQVLDLVAQAYGPAFDRDSIDAARLASHLRYFVTRARTGSQVADGTATLIAEPLKAERPRAYRVARQIAELLELRLGTPVNEDEVSYLTIHVARIEAAGRG